MTKSLLMQEFIYYFLPCKIESLRRIDIMYYRSCSANQNYRNCVIYNRNGEDLRQGGRRASPYCKSDYKKLLYKTSRYVAD